MPPYNVLFRLLLPDLINRILYTLSIMDGHSRGVLSFLLTCKEAYYTHLHVLYRLGIVRVNCARFQKKNCEMLKRSDLPIFFMVIKNVDDDTQFFNLKQFERLVVLGCELGYSRKPEALWHKLFTSVPPNTRRLTLFVNGNYPLPYSEEYLKTHDIPWLPKLEYFSFWCKSRPVIRTGNLLSFKPWRKPQQAEDFGGYLFCMLNNFRHSLTVLALGNVDCAALGFLLFKWKVLASFPSLQWLVLSQDIEYYQLGDYLISGAMFRILVYDSFNNDVLLYQSHRIREEKEAALESIQEEEEVDKAVEEEQEEMVEDVEEGEGEDVEEEYSEEEYEKLDDELKESARHLMKNVLKIWGFKVPTEELYVYTPCRL